MSLHFAKYWNNDYRSDSRDTDGKIQVNGEEFTYQSACKVIKAAIATGLAGALKTCINTGRARVIKGPHKTSGGDTHLHITVRCERIDPRTGGYLQVTTYHIGLSRQGNYSSINSEYGNKTGHRFDDPNAPAINTCDDL